MPKTYYMPLYIITGVFGAIFIIGPLAVRKCANKGIIRCCIMLTAFCMWIFWVTVYIAQMNPLVGPRLSSDVIGWMAHKWGNTAESAEAEEPPPIIEDPPPIIDDRL